MDPSQNPGASLLLLCPSNRVRLEHPLWCSSLTAPFECTQGIVLTAPLQSHRGPLEDSHAFESVFSGASQGDRKGRDDFLPVQAVSIKSEKQHQVENTQSSKEDAPANTQPRKILPSRRGGDPHKSIKTQKVKRTQEHQNS